MAGKLRKIAVEEAFSIREVANELKKVARAPGDSARCTSGSGASPS
jgi:hypothetical protein